MFESPARAGVSRGAGKSQDYKTRKSFALRNGNGVSLSAAAGAGFRGCWMRWPAMQERVSSHTRAATRRRSRRAGPRARARGGRARGGGATGRYMNMPC